MKISMISEHASPLATPGSVDAGGQNVHVAALSRALARRGHAVTVYTRRDDEALPERVQLDAGVEVVHVPAGPAARIPKDDLLPYMPELAAGVAADWAANGPPDVVHGHFWMSGLAAADAARASASPPAVLQTFHALGTVKRRHQGAADTSPPQRAWLEPRVGREVDMVVATCADEVDELTAMGVRRDRVRIAPCGVDLDEFTLDGPVDRRGAALRILSIGRLVPRKDVELVIRAMTLLPKRGVTDVELVVVGASGAGVTPDPEVERLRKVASQLGVADRVRFRGQVPRKDVPSLLRSADVVACTPWYEPFGIVPLESMACGAPVVAARVGGLADTVVDGSTGLLVRPRDERALADGLVKLLTDAALRASMGRAGRARVETRYTWDRVAATTEQIYAETMALASQRSQQLAGAAS
ncbi:glycosyltransferase [Pseudoclavibacter terrae]|uniref:Glycosyltransferase family 1 protein n=1 Tax=Pseudoclavibacter terrae TaxID=1530195 RepID=A0A7J5B671_9MICO|nr:glycosyltransferase [Pseudoclavibacter terrae]KAB1638790.1 glycosyltransferase family 1 protein [Pseudoclavibacter terrae]